MRGRGALRLKYSVDFKEVSDQRLNDLSVDRSQRIIGEIVNLESEVKGFVEACPRSLVLTFLMSFM